MYLQHFCLDRAPFRLTPDESLFYTSPNHARAKAYMDYALMKGEGFVAITGEIGAGKTTLLNRQLAQLDDRWVVIRIDHTQLSEVEILSAVLRGLEADAPRDVDKLDLVDRIRARMSDLSQAGKTVLLAIDEAQSLSFRALEELRMLAGMDLGDGRGFTVILLGQPELARILDGPGMEQLRQRVRLRFHLRGMPPPETRKYVEARLQLAGTPYFETIFEEDVYATIQEYTAGIPRLINTLCDMALLTAYLESRPSVDQAMLRMAIGELEWVPHDARDSLGAGSEPPALSTGRVTVPARMLQRTVEALERIAIRLAEIATILGRGDPEPNDSVSARGERTNGGSASAAAGHGGMADEWEAGAASGKVRSATAARSRDR